jgi:hypothetical protein
MTNHSPAETPAATHAATLNAFGRGQVEIAIDQLRDGEPEAAQRSMIIGVGAATAAIEFGGDDAAELADFVQAAMIEADAIAPGAIDWTAVLGDPDA